MRWAERMDTEERHVKQHDIYKKLTINDLKLYYNDVSIIRHQRFNY